jgi:N-acyl homoserine lactone hydrolase
MWFVFGLAARAAPVPTVTFVPPPAAPVEIVAPGPVVHEAVVSARWAVPLSGLIDLKDPAAAALEPGRHPIVLPVHVLVHPTAGTFVVDTGVPAARSPARGLLAWFARDVEPVEPLADIVARQPAPLAGVLLTHGHLDHVLGLVDVPTATVYAGRGEEAPANAGGRLMFPTFRRALGDRPLTVWDFDGPGAVDIDGVRAIDIVGDGSIYALDAAGHTPGSTAYLARTSEGPVLFTGDCSHTRWGWDHGVTPGRYTVDHEHNARSLAALRKLAAAFPGLRVEVGHEL